MLRKFFFLFVVLSLLTSCWDLTEIEEVGFVVAVALDPLEKKDLELFKEQFQKETGMSPGHLYKTTYQVVIPGATSEEGGATEDAFFNITSVGRTNFKMNRTISTRRSRRPKYEHLKVILINEELLKTGAMIGHLIDFYIRDHEMRRNALVYISKGAANGSLQHKLPLEIMPAKSIRMVQENYKANHAMPPPKKIGDLAIDIINEQSFILPRITPFEGIDFKIAGAGVFLGRTNELVGWLGEMDYLAYSLVTGEAFNAILEVDKDGKLFVLEIDTMGAIVNYQRKNDQDYFKIEIMTEGFLGESWLGDIELSEDMNEMLEIAVKEQIEHLAKNIIHKTQSEFHADIFGLFKEVKQNNYRYWKGIEDNWDGEGGMFSKATIDVSAKVKIRHYMTEEKVS
ncbi:hypothetical protein BKP45_04450 [Anaerobacillus alkalidiazotrophicus]|uniref:Uncharacterized protein n=1 Tax=Anaerobacillus alkalidiazotrophicus TaxID=472963 RepID=A0A1S2ME17_9BACI|nr:Ger(x)C family spore germination protein [Anaerobacillus alkalidiazotrophicus]OIJ21935.1 hypothetical protein BKP45_04450 [Anaerobacillus alkalidiazotrophicus]